MSKPRGFAAMSPEKRAELSRMGGKRAHELGRGHQWTSEEAAAAARKGVRARKDRRAQCEGKEPV